MKTRSDVLVERIRFFSTESKIITTHKPSIFDLFMKLSSVCSHWSSSYSQMKAIPRDLQLASVHIHRANIKHDSQYSPVSAFIFLVPCLIYYGCQVIHSLSFFLLDGSVL